MIRRPPRSTLDRSSAASDVYKRQGLCRVGALDGELVAKRAAVHDAVTKDFDRRRNGPVSYTHLRAHETVLDLVCRLLLEKKQTEKTYTKKKKKKTIKEIMTNTTTAITKGHRLRHRLIGVKH